MRDVEGRSSDEVTGSIYLGVTPLTQRLGIPLSLELSGSYGFARVDNDYLSENDLMMRGQGFDLQAAIKRRFYVRDSSAVRMGVVGSYRSFVYTTQEQSPPATPTITTIRDNRLEWGMLLGYETVSRSGLRSSLDLVGTVDDDLNLGLGVVVQMAFLTAPY